MITSLKLADPQAISSRFGDAVWLTDYITPNNPDVRLKYRELTQGVNSLTDRVVACWQYVANIPYRETVIAELRVNGSRYTQTDIWLFPSEVIRLTPVANCSNKSFLLTSLLLNELSPGMVKCVLGHVSIDGIGAHAWVRVFIDGQWYILETTLPDLERALIPLNRAEAYIPAVDFDQNSVYTVSQEGAKDIINEHFGFCPIPFLRNYLCERCLEV